VRMASQTVMLANVDSDDHVLGLRMVADVIHDNQHLLNWAVLSLSELRHGLYRDRRRSIAPDCRRGFHGSNLGGSGVPAAPRCLAVAVSVYDPRPGEILPNIRHCALHSLPRPVGNAALGSVLVGGCDPLERRSPAAAWYHGWYYDLRLRDTNGR
jgi:hypothetical protein